jgi:hypothetical protein
MQLPHNATGLIRKLAEEVGESRDNSLFSLLLRLEQQIYGSGVNEEVPQTKSKAAIVSNQRRSILVYPRYIE